MLLKPKDNHFQANLNYLKRAYFNFTDVIQQFELESDFKTAFNYIS